VKFVKALSSERINAAPGFQPITSEGSRYAPVGGLFQQVKYGQSNPSSLDLVQFVLQSIVPQQPSLPLSTDSLRLASHVQDVVAATQSGIITPREADALIYELCKEFASRRAREALSTSALESVLESTRIS